MYQPDYTIHYGNKYKAGMDIADIAKAVRADIKAAQKAKQLPKEMKTSVRISRFAGGQSLDVKVQRFPYECYTEEYKKAELAGENCYAMFDNERAHTKEYKNAMKVLKAIVGAYNYDGSDTMVDYFNVNFYGNVDFDYTFMRAEIQAYKDHFGAEAA